MRVGQRIMLEDKQAVVTQVKPHAIEVAFMGGGRRWIKPERITRSQRADKPRD